MCECGTESQILSVCVRERKKERWNEREKEKERKKERKRKQ